MDVSPDAGAGGAQTAESADAGAADEELAQANAEIEALPLHRLDALIQRHTRERLQLTRRVDELDAKYSKVRAHFAHSIPFQNSAVCLVQTRQLSDADGSSFLVDMLVGFIGAKNQMLLVLAYSKSTQLLSELTCSIKV